MSRLHFMILVGILTAAIAAGLYHAQESASDATFAGVLQPPPVDPIEQVAFIDGTTLGTASPSSEGEDGLSRLSDMLRQLGASTRRIPPDAPIPPDVELVIIIRPQRPFSAPLTAYLWDFLDGGGHLLLALDPNGHNRVNSERARTSGINRLLELEYGLSLSDDFLIEPWFRLENLSEVTTSWAEGQPEQITAHPITQPLLDYGLPLRFWGGRSLFVEAVTGNAATTALFYADTSYGETARVNFAAEDPDQLILHIGEDTQGHLLLGGVAHNYQTGSRVAVLGDSEIFQNVYGLTRIPGRETLPRYPGDYVFTQRVLAWLMGLPEDDWPSLPEGFTWIALDGSVDEWPSGLAEYVDAAFEMDDLQYDLQQVQLFHNDQFLYLRIETVAGVPSDVQVRLRLDRTEEPVWIQAVDNAVMAIYRTDLVAPVPDAGYGTSPAVEIRIPLRVVGENPVLAEICLLSSASQIEDCLEAPMASRPVPTLDPVPVRLGNRPAAFTAEEANIRRGPGLNQTLITRLPARTLLAVEGRNASGDWLRVRNGRYSGWIAEFLLVTNADVATLPVLE